MVVISWKDSYTVHVESIDNQHKAMMRLINDLHDVSTSRDSESNLEQAIDELFEFTQRHFQYEESFLEKYHYPFFPAHHEEHQEFIRVFERTRKEISSLGDTGKRRLVEFMVNWLQNHIEKEDKQYVSFMLEHGIK